MRSNSPIIALALGLSACAISKPAKPKNFSESSRLKTWCVIESPRPSLLKDWEELDTRSVHLVNKLKQKEAMERLRYREYIELDTDKAKDYIRSDHLVNNGKHIYLIRTAAFNVNSDFEIQPVGKGLSPLSVSYSPTGKKILVSAYAFGMPDPVNIAVIVEVPGDVNSVEGRCLRAL